MEIFFWAINHSFPGRLNDFIAGVGERGGEDGDKNGGESCGRMIDFKQFGGLIRYRQMDKWTLVILEALSGIKIYH